MTKKKMEVKADTVAERYLFNTALCCCRYIKVPSVCDDEFGGTIAVQNFYRKDGEKFDKCTRRHPEVFESIKNKTVRAYGFTCTFLQGDNINDRYMVFDKAPEGAKRRLKK